MDLGPHGEGVVSVAGLTKPVTKLKKTGAPPVFAAGWLTG
jgi:hypothetical protein